MPCWSWRYFPFKIPDTDLFVFVVSQGKHCLLDVTPNAVEQLNYAQCYPIVIFLNAESRAHVKEIRGQFLREGVENKGSRKHYQTAKKMKKFYAYVFTGMKEKKKNIRVQLHGASFVGHEKYRCVVTKPQAFLPTHSDNHLFTYSCITNIQSYNFM